MAEWWEADRPASKADQWWAGDRPAQETAPQVDTAADSAARGLPPLEVPIRRGGFSGQVGQAMAQRGPNAQDQQATPQPLTAGLVSERAGQAATGLASGILGAPGDIQEIGIPGFVPGAAELRSRGFNTRIFPTSSEVGNDIAEAPQDDQAAITRGLGSFMAPGAALKMARVPGAVGRVMTGTAAVPRGATGADRGQIFAQELARKSGVTPDALEAAQGGKPLTAAEAIGPSAETHLMATARREGTAGPALGAKMAERATGRQQRVFEDMANSSGIHPEAAKGDIEAVVASGQAKAKPIFDEALASPEPLWNEDLARLAERPAVKKAIASAVEDLRNADIDPGTWGLIPASEVAKAEKGETLFEAVRRLGGIRVNDKAGYITREGGEVRAALKDVRTSGVINNQTGLTPDYMREALQQDGWFGRTETSGQDIDEFYQALKTGKDYLHPEAGAKISPKSVYEANEANLQGWRDRAAAMGVKVGRDWEAADIEAAMEERAAMSGMPMPKAPALGRVAAGGAKVGGQTLQPTAEAWDLIRKHLNYGLERDAFGKIKPDSVSIGNRNLNASSRDLTGALKTAIPGYDKALAVSGDYLSSKAAFDRGQTMILDAKVTEDQFAKAVAKMSESEREALKGGIANKIFDLVQSNRLSPKQFLTPRTRAKLDIALGRDQSRMFVQNLQREMEMAAFEKRAVAASGSPTMGLMEAARAQDEFGQSAVANAAADVVTHGPRAALINYLGGKKQQVADFIKTSGLDVEGRNELARLLMLPPAELAQVLKSIPGNVAPSGVNNAFAALKPRQNLGGGLGANALVQLLRTQQPTANNN